MNFKEFTAAESSVFEQSCKVIAVRRAAMSSVFDDVVTVLCVMELNFKEFSAAVGSVFELRCTVFAAFIAAMSGVFGEITHCRLEWRSLRNLRTNPVLFVAMKIPTAAGAASKS